jgi:hypothetical protein
LLGAMLQQYYVLVVYPQGTAPQHPLDATGKKNAHKVDFEIQPKIDGIMVIILIYRWYSLIIGQSLLVSDILLRMLSSQYGHADTYSYSHCRLSD